MTLFFIGSDIYEIKRIFKRRKLSKVINFHPRNYQVTVLIPAHNEEAVIIRCLESVFKSEYKRIKVVVVNDGSTDQTKTLVNNYKALNKLSNLKLINKENSGKADSLNLALGNVRSALVMVLDADSIVQPDTISIAVRHFDNTKVVAAATNVRITHNLNSIVGAVQLLEFSSSFRFKRALTTFNMEYIIGGMSFFRYKTLKKVGFFDTDTVTEDIDLTLKLVSLGNKQNRIIFAGDSITYTEGAGSFRALLKQRYRWKYGRFQTFVKNRKLFFNRDPKYSRSLAFFYLPWSLVQELISLLDPFIIIFWLVVSIYLGNYGTFRFIIIFYTVFVLLITMTEERLNLAARFRLVVYAPLGYLFFLTVGLVEYLALIRCILNYRKIVQLEQEIGGWDHIQRDGGSLG
ncbi:glycosyltransferase family 2 protein [Candidatus Nomurabacteria bacterium]|nr:glycosyltransferase family 2 protein [Candidatus Nomurabacteria bacterium]